MIERRFFKLMIKTMPSRRSRSYQNGLASESNGNSARRKSSKRNSTRQISGGKIQRGRGRDLRRRSSKQQTKSEPRALGLADMPQKLVDSKGKVFFIRDKVPRGFKIIGNKPVGKGGHNEVYKVRYGGPKSRQYLFRKNTDGYDEELEIEVASEVGYNIKFSAAGIAPKIYDYGYAPGRPGQPGFYWQVMEMFDESLYAFNHRVSQAVCDATRDSIESQLIRKFAIMAKMGSFCYDIHPRNVVLRHKKRNKVEVALIDFDHTFCINPSRIHNGFRGGNKKRPHYALSVNNLLFAMLLVFSSNSHRHCGKIYFREKMLQMLSGKSKFLVEGGGRVDLGAVLRFLDVSIAQGKDSTKTILRYYNGLRQDKGTVIDFAEYVLGRKVNVQGRQQGNRNRNNNNTGKVQRYTR